MKNPSRKVQKETNTPFPSFHDQRFIDSLYEGIVVFNPKGDILLYNKAVENIFNISATELIGRSAMDGWITVHEDGTPFPVEEHPAVYTLKTGKPCQDVIMGITNPDGFIHWVSMNSRASICPDTQKLFTVTCSFKDITQLINTKQELVRLNDRYEYSRKATSDAIWDWEIEQDIIYHGEVATRLFGHPEQNTSMEIHASHVHPKDRVQYVQSIKQALAGKNDYWHAEYRYRNARNSYCTVLDRAYILRNEKKKAIRMIGAMQDITASRKLEKKLLQETVNRKRKIVKAIIHAQEEERKEIAYELHDNVSQLLATCRLYIDTALKTKNNRDLLKECNELLLNTIDEVRNLSHNIMPAAFAEKGLFTTVTDMVKKLDALGKVSVELILPEDHALETMLPPDAKTAIYRIIQEQLNNILKHAKASAIHIRFHQSGQYLQVEIRDNGVGFDVTKVKRGLGLNNIHSRVSLYEGSMSLQSATGKGCLLKVDFPLTIKA